MSRPKKGLRKISVDGQIYHWTVSGYTLTVSPAEHEGGRLLIVDYGAELEPGGKKTLPREIPGLDTEIGYDLHRIDRRQRYIPVIPPRIVADAVRAAKGLGWLPEFASNTPVRLRFEAGEYKKPNKRTQSDL